MTARLRSKQVSAWLILALFIAGFFVHPIGTWTGSILGVWFAGTQKPLRGFLWIAAFSFVPGVFVHGRLVISAGPQALAYLALAAAVSALPFLFHRLVSGRLTGLWATLPFPVAHGALLCAARAMLASHPGAALPREFALLFPAALIVSPGLPAFAPDWFAAALVRAWNLEFRRKALASLELLLAGVAALLAAFWALLLLQAQWHWPGRSLGSFTWISAGAVVLLAAWAIFFPAGRERPWNQRAATLDLLRSPSTGEPLRLIREGRSEVLAGASGEHFPIRHGMADFLRPQDLTGANRKYNQLYETIGGFYDDSQRVICALSGMDRDAYVMSYMGLLQVKPGDAVLETSVGTGLNFNYLPRGIRRFGLDLSAQMLAACRENLRRWEMEADLFLGNAEALPFADASFDVVFHVGGINFFSDRAAAIREMIRVARPGTLLLIADETEEHVKAAYENIPYTREFYKDRSDAVSAPIDLLPPEMEDVRLRILEVAGKKRFYALTFRKPGTKVAPLSLSQEAAPARI